MAAGGPRETPPQYFTKEVVNEGRGEYFYKYTGRYWADREKENWDHMPSIF